MSKAILVKTSSKRYLKKRSAPWERHEAPLEFVSDLSEEFLEMFEDRPLGMVVAREVFALAEALHGLALPLVEGLGDEDAHLDDEVSRAVAIALDGR